VDQAELVLQLKVWKDLAISKQMLMRTASDALKLDPKCTQDELAEALEATFKKLAQSDLDLKNAREQAKTTIAEMDKKLLTLAKAQAAAEASVVELTTTQEKLNQQIATERTLATKDMQSLKERLAEKERALKAINTALADTPENVLKKMKVLKKEKQDEANARRDVEAALSTERKEKQQQDQKLAAAVENGGKLVTQHKELHAVALKLQEQLKPLLTDEKELPAVAELDEKLLEDVLQPSAKSDKANGNKSDKANGKSDKPSSKSDK
jgi:chromosome segregation ATPase